MAHRLRFDRSSKCATPHGHNEFIKITLKSDTLSPHWGKSNMAKSFESLKKSWHHFIDNSLDHAFQLGEDDPLIDHFKTYETDILPRLLIIKGDPTTEATAVALWQKLSVILDNTTPDFRIIRLELEETPTNCITLEADTLWQNIELGAWCHRFDLSINDLVPPTVFPHL
jgi:6-pyruvoyltetrahydropterin/6-carboxytetrahydropterin synthase